MTLKQRTRAARSETARERETRAVAAAAASLLDVPIRRRPADGEWAGTPGDPPAPPAAGQASATPASPATPATPTPPAPQPVRSPSEDLIAYWEGLKDDRRYPSPDSVDEKAIGEIAAQAFLMRCQPDGQFHEVERVVCARMFEFDWFDDNAGMILEWLHNLGNEAVRLGIPIVETDTFPSRAGPVRCTGTILPFSVDGRVVDRLLCCLHSEARA